jgi:hypothetical protein
MTIHPLAHFLKKYYFFDENSEPNKFTFEDDTIKAVSEWLIQFRVSVEERYAKYDACIIQDLIDRLEIPRKEEAKNPWPTIKEAELPGLIEAMRKCDEENAVKDCEKEGNK